MSWVEIISAILGLSCVFLAGRNSKYNFWVGYAYSIFLFILFLLFGILAFLICTCLISLNRHYAKTLTNNEEAYQNREIHTAKEWMLASLLLLRNACLDPFIWSSLVCFLVGWLVG